MSKFKIELTEKEMAVLRELLDYEASGSEYRAAIIEADHGEVPSSWDDQLALIGARGRAAQLRELSGKFREEVAA